MPRKTWKAEREKRDRQWASMRPRPDAAENGPAPTQIRGRRAASMRPRPDAAENVACATVTAATMALQ